MIIAAMLTAVAAVSSPAVYLSPDAIDRAVADFTGYPIGMAGGARLAADRRLRLHACPQELQLSWFGKNRRNVLVRCPGTDGWQVYIPIVPDDKSVMAASSAREEAVARGDQVTVIVAGPGFAVTGRGQAMESGAVGDWIRVKAAGKPEPVRGQVVQPGRIRIELP